VSTGTYKLTAGLAPAPKLFKVGAGAETKSFGSAPVTVYDNFFLFSQG
jgi:hypothetical protein